MEQYFALDSDIQDDISIINFQGFLDANSEDEINSTFLEISQGGVKKIILNFENVIRVNSTGIAILLGIVSDSRENGQLLAMCNLTPHFLRIFDLVGLTQYVKNFQTPQQAIDYLKTISA